MECCSYKDWILYDHLIHSYNIRCRIYNILIVTNRNIRYIRYLNNWQYRKAACRPEVNQNITNHYYWVFLIFFIHIFQFLTYHIVTTFYSLCLCVLHAVLQYILLCYSCILSHKSITTHLINLLFFDWLKQ